VGAAPPPPSPRLVAPADFAAFSGFAAVTGFSAFSAFAARGVVCGFAVRVFSAFGFAGAVFAGRFVPGRPGATELLPRAGVAAGAT